ncbi:MAG: hypothetical protein GY708_30120 [Actinomycetia bacterium]|nr:hypothetical protein [Actinomycetes bacterium]
MVARLTIGAVLLVAVAVATGVGSRSAEASDGLSVDAAYAYRLDPQGQLTVEATFTLKNVKANRRSGYTIYSYYFDGFAVPVPDNAVDLLVTDGSSDLTYELVTEEYETEVIDGEEIEGGEFAYAAVTFRRNLNYGRTTTVVASYRIEGSQPRSEFIDRINPAYAFFGAWGIADPGQLDVTIELPPGFEIETTGSHMRSENTESGGSVYSATDIDDPDDFFVTVIARNDGALDPRSILVAGSMVTIRSWPGDDEWEEFAVETAREGIPTLERLIGKPWPEDKDFEIIQSSEPNFHGYAGWYDGDEGRIVIDEGLDTAIFLHELGHAWFNDGLSDDRWITEAMAEEFARLAALELGAEAPKPEEPEPASFSRQLNTWSNMMSSDETENWGYSTSSWVMYQLSEEVGPDLMDNIVVALFDGTATYPDEEGDGSTDRPVDWKRLLDVSEHLAGSTGFEDVLSEYVLLGSEVDLLAGRREALDDIARLTEAGGEWFVPLGIRERAERWDFEDIERLVDEGLAVLALRDELTTRSEAATLNDPAVGEGIFERTFDSYSSSEARITRWLEAIAVVESITERSKVEPSLLEQLGLWGQDPDAELLEVRSAYDAGDPDLVDVEAAQLRALLDDAEDVGLFRAKLGGAIAGVVLLLLVILVIWRVRRRRRRKRFETWREKLDAELPRCTPVPV